MTINKPFDRISFELLRHLSNDARLSNKQLATAVGLAPSTTYERLKQLRASSIYRGAHADVNLVGLGFVIEALIHVGLMKHKRNAVDTFAAQLESISEVRQAFLVTGRFDLIVHVVIRDMEHLKNLAYQFTSHEAVDRIETSVVFQTWKQHHLPKPIWLSERDNRSADSRERRKNHSAISNRRPERRAKQASK